MFLKVKHSSLLRYRHILGDKKVLDPLRVETELQRNSLKLLVKPTKLQKWHHYIQYNDIQRNDIQRNDIQHNDIQCNDIEHNDTQHYDTQHNSI
jgi:hypothetical protein